MTRAVIWAGMLSQPQVEDKTVWDWLSPAIMQ